MRLYEFASEQELVESPYKFLPNITRKFAWELLGNLANGGEQRKVLIQKFRELVKGGMHKDDAIEKLDLETDAGEELGRRGIVSILRNAGVY